MKSNLNRLLLRRSPMARRHAGANRPNEAARPQRGRAPIFSVCEACRQKESFSVLPGPHIFASFLHCVHTVRGYWTQCGPSGRIFLRHTLQTGISPPAHIAVRLAHSDGLRRHAAIRWGAASDVPGFRRGKLAVNANRSGWLIRTVCAGMPRHDRERRVMYQDYGGDYRGDH